MSVIRSEVDPTSETFAARRAEMLELLDTVRTLESVVRSHAEKARAKFDKRGQLLPRERVQRLLEGFRDANRAHRRAQLPGDDVARVVV